MKTAFQILVLFFIFSCTGNDDKPRDIDPVVENPSLQTLKYLALGDSYTIGQSVCESCRFPAQLAVGLESELDLNMDLDIIAQTGWTTAHLKNAIAAENPSSDYDLVTLLIGVNNQYQNQPFSNYQQQFPELLSTAIALAKGDKDRVIVVSIPDYAFTPFGQSASNPGLISSEIDQYNAFAENHTAAEGVVFVNITDITRMGLENQNLVASDGLHPSELAYGQFVTRLLPIATQKLQ